MYVCTNCGNDQFVEKREVMVEYLIDAYGDVYEPIGLPEDDGDHGYDLPKCAKCGKLAEWVEED